MSLDQVFTYVQLLLTLTLAVCPPAKADSLGFSIRFLCFIWLADAATATAFDLILLAFFELVFLAWSS